MNFRSITDNYLKQTKNIMKKKLKPKNSDNDYQLYALLQRKIVSDTITPKELEKLNELKELL